MCHNGKDDIHHFSNGLLLNRKRSANKHPAFHGSLQMSHIRCCASYQHKSDSRSKHQFMLYKWTSHPEL